MQVAFDIRKQTGAVHYETRDHHFSQITWFNISQTVGLSFKHKLVCLYCPVKPGSKACPFNLHRKVKFLEVVDIQEIRAKHRSQGEWTLL